MVAFHPLRNQHTTVLTFRRCKLLLCNVLIQANISARCGVCYIQQIAKELHTHLRVRTPLAYHKQPAVALYPHGFILGKAHGKGIGVQGFQAVSHPVVKATIVEGKRRGPRTLLGGSQCFTRFPGTVCQRNKLRRAKYNGLA